VRNVGYRFVIPSVEKSQTPANDHQSA
jgi:hypothetical protein